VGEREKVIVAFHSGRVKRSRVCMFTYLLETLPIVEEGPWRSGVMKYGGIFFE